MKRFLLSLLYILIGSFGSLVIVSTVGIFAQDFFLKIAIAKALLSSYHADSENHGYGIYFIIGLMVYLPVGGMVGGLGGLGCFWQRHRVFQPWQTQRALITLGLSGLVLSSLGIALGFGVFWLSYRESFRSVALS